MIDPELWDRFRALRRRPKLRAAVRADAEQAVRSSQYGTAKACWIPDPPLPPAPNALPPTRLDHPQARFHGLAGVDADGRATVVRNAMSWDGRPQRPVVQGPGEDDDDVLHSRVLGWEGNRLEVIGFLCGDAVSHVTWIDHDEAGRPVRWQTAGLEHNDFGKGWSLVECDWDGDRPVEVRALEAEESGRPMASRYVAVHDADGLASVTRHLALDAPEDWCDVPVAEHGGWERDLHAFEPDPLRWEAAVAALVEPVAAAARRALARADTADPWVVRVALAHDSASVSVTGLGDARRAARHRTPEDVFAHGSAGWGADLVPDLGGPGLHAWRSLRQQDGPTREPFAAAAADLGRRLAELEWPGDVIALAWHPDGLDAMLELARGCLGPRVDVALERLGTVAPAPAPAATRLRSRDDARELIARYELPASVAEQARWGCAMLGRGRGRSRLGGRPLVPPGTEWPVHDGVRLTHLLSLDLAELPDHPDRGMVPAAGVVAVFLDLSDGAVPDDRLAVGESEDVRVLWSPPGVAPVELQAPRRAHPGDERPTFRGRRVRFEPVLTLPSAPRGLRGGDEDLYADVYHELAEVTPGQGDGGHLVGGHPDPIHHDPCEPGEVSLLHFVVEDAFGFEYLVDGAVTLLGTAADVAAGRLDRLRAVVEFG